MSQLCFEVGGILGQIPAQLGATVTPFNFTSFYSGLGAAPGDGSLLTFNSQGILTAAPVAASLLAALRAESRAAALDRAVVMRQNAFFAKYAPSIVTSIVSTSNTFFGTGANAKPALLQSLSTLAQSQATQLQTAYTADGRTGVVKTTNSSLNSTTTTTDSSTGSGQSTTTTTPNLITTSTGQSNEVGVGGQNLSDVALNEPGKSINEFGNPPAGGGSVQAFMAGTASASVQEGTTGQTSTETGSSRDVGMSSQTSTGQASAAETQTIVNTDYAYRVPFVESQAQNARAQISLIDQQFAQFMSSQNLPNLATVLQNELTAMDRGVHQMQVAFLDTILLSPIAGTVTGTYKNPGDCVSAGEPVLRVEDNSTIFLLGTFIYRGPIQIGSTVSVTTQLFDASGTPTTVSGPVVAVRSRGDDDQFDFIVQCTNPLNASNKPTFPIGYVFDYDNTTATVTP